MAATAFAQRSRTVWMGLSIVPLTVGWVIAMLTQPREALPQVLWIGGLAVGGAVICASALWRRASSHDRIGWRALAELTLAVGASAALWTWVQYALNPFRMRS